MGGQRLGCEVILVAEVGELEIEEATDSRNQSVCTVPGC
jgi:hypothetical protein